jgi:hypothetical protein
MTISQKNLLYARLTFAFHVILIIHYIMGSVLAWYINWYAWVQLVNLVGTVLIHLKWHNCPFTKLEKLFIERAGRKPYNGSLYQYYFFQKIFQYDASKNFVSTFLILTKLLPACFGASLIFF